MTDTSLPVFMLSASMGALTVQFENLFPRFFWTVTGILISSLIYKAATSDFDLFMANIYAWMDFAARHHDVVTGICSGVLLMLIIIRTFPRNRRQDHDWTG